VGRLRRLVALLPGGTRQLGHRRERQAPRLLREAIVVIVIVVVGLLILTPAEFIDERRRDLFGRGAERR